MRWCLSYRFDPRAKLLADRHYSRQKPESNQFVAPGRCLVLLTSDATALWVTSWPEYVDHQWAGAWNCALFRNEAPERHLSSELILEAVAATRWRWPLVPALGMVTFIDPAKVKRKRDPGRCFRRAGFVEVGFTKIYRRMVLQLSPDKMPAPAAPAGAQLQLLG